MLRFSAQSLLIHKIHRICLAPLLIEEMILAMKREGCDPRRWGTLQSNGERMRLTAATLTNTRYTWVSKGLFDKYTKQMAQTPCCLEKWQSIVVAEEYEHQIGTC